MVQLKFSDGSSVTVFEKSSVNIAQYGKSKDNPSTLESAIEIAHGKLRFFVNPKGELKKNAKFKTKSAIMGIRGTSGVIDASASGDTQLVVLTGKVEVTNPKFPQVPVMVEPNFLTRVSKEAAPIPPIVASKEVLSSLVPAAPAAAGFTDDAPVGSAGAKSKENQERTKPASEKDSKDDSKKQKPNEKEQGQHKNEEGSNGNSGSSAKPAGKSIKPLFSPGGEVVNSSPVTAKELNMRGQSAVSPPVEKEGDLRSSGQPVPDLNSSLNKSTTEVMKQAERINSTVQSIVDTAERAVQTQIQVTPPPATPSSNSIKVKVKLPDR